MSYASSQESRSGVLRLQTTTPRWVRFSPRLRPLSLSCLRPVVLRLQEELVNARAGCGWGRGGVGCAQYVCNVETLADVSSSSLARVFDEGALVGGGQRMRGDGEGADERTCRADVRAWRWRDMPVRRGQCGRCTLRVQRLGGAADDGRGVKRARRDFLSSSRTPRGGALVNVPLARGKRCLRHEEKAADECRGRGSDACEWQSGAGGARAQRATPKEEELRRSRGARVRTTREKCMGGRVRDVQTHRCASSSSRFLIPLLIGGGGHIPFLPRRPASSVRAPYAAAETVVRLGGQKTSGVCAM
ncbi:hypothetical protein DFH09DRAFT_1348811 [Mycena vulgaris]|nr:hypothetical protein DFH09DRAFT_1348811 [Mycena vulgaris]